MTLGREDSFSRVMRNILPENFAHTMLRFLYAARTLLFFFACQTFPKFFRGVMQGMAAKQLPKNIPVDPHFTPRYNPWDQRVSRPRHVLARTRLSFAFDSCASRPEAISSSVCAQARRTWSRATSSTSRTRASS